MTFFFEVFVIQVKYRVEKISKIKRVEEELFLLIFPTRSFLELKYRVEKISKIKRVEDKLFLLIFFYEVFN